MPNTSNYGFDYESPTSLPGTTLTGGPTTTMPILAIQVDAALAALNNTVTDQASSIAANQASITANQTSITNLTNWTRTGTVNISLTSVNSTTVPVNFGFTFPAVPKVFGNIDSGSGVTARWIARPINPTTTGFTMFVFSASSDTSTWVDIPVNWVAHYRP